MSGSIAIDVTIGLIFIYLLYSLLASIISEIAATGLGLRSRNLKYAIFRMLEDDNSKNINLSKLQILNLFRELLNTIKRFFMGIKSGNGFLFFYSHPAIKYLSRDKFNSSPSYITKNTFSKVLIDILSQINSTPIVKKTDAIKNTLENITEPKKSADQNDFLSNIENFQNSKLLSKETNWYIKSLLEEADEDLDKFKELLEKWFDETMERATSWYKGIIQIIILFIGFIIALAFNVNTFQIVGILSTDKDARNTLVEMAISYSESDKFNNTINLIYSNDTISIQDPNIEANLPLERLNELKNEKQKLEEEIFLSRNILGTGWNIPEVINLKLNDRQNIHDIKSSDLGETLFEIEINDKIFSTFISTNIDQEILRKIIRKVIFKNEISTKNKGSLEIPISQLSYFSDYVFKNFFGFLTTALAISLGAPFWFDLLDKFIKVRTALKPAEDVEKK